MLGAGFVQTLDSIIDRGLREFEFFGNGERLDAAEVSTGNAASFVRRKLPAFHVFRHVGAEMISFRTSYGRRRGDEKRGRYRSLNFGGDLTAVPQNRNFR